jgi:hypothetical protein
VNSVKKSFLTLVAMGLVAVMPAAAVAAPSGGTKGPAKAHAAGSGAPPVIPSIVQVRITRGTTALTRAGDYVDQDQPDKAVASLLNARRNMYAAWRGATYYVEHAPPPPAAAGRFHRTPKAKSSGAAVTGTAYADAPTTGLAALGFQHTVATAAYGLLDGAKGALRDAVSTTIFAALNRRDAAIEYIHAIPPPPAAAARVNKSRAHASGAPIVSGWDTQMQGMLPDLDDELMQIEGLIAGGALTPGEKRIMNMADVQVIKTQRKINQYWPPLPAG